MEQNKLKPCSWTNNYSDLHFSPWRERCDFLVSEIDHDLESWAHCANDDISNTTQNIGRFGDLSTDLK